jgi:hypothetical protein
MSKLPEWNFGRSESEQEMCQETHDATMASIRFYIDELHRFYRAMAASSEVGGNYDGRNVYLAKAAAMEFLVTQLNKDI